MTTNQSWRAVMWLFVWGTAVISERVREWWVVFFTGIPLRGLAWWRSCVGARRRIRDSRDLRCIASSLVDLFGNDHCRRNTLRPHAVAVSQCAAFDRLSCLL